MTTVKNTVLYKCLKNSAQPYFWQSPENLKMDWSERKAKSEPSCNLVLIQFIQRNPMITKTPEFHHLFFGGESNHAILFAFQTFLSHHLCQIWLACEPLFDGWLIRCSPPLFFVLTGPFVQWPLSSLRTIWRRADCRDWFQRTRSHKTWFFRIIIAVADFINRIQHWWQRMHQQIAGSLLAHLSTNQPSFLPRLDHIL